MNDLALFPLSPPCGLRGPNQKDLSPSPLSAPRLKATLAHWLTAQLFTIQQKQFPQAVEKYTRFHQCCPCLGMSTVAGLAVINWLAQQQRQQKRK